MQKKHFDSEEVHKGITATSGGFYGPQGRVLRLELDDAKLNDTLSTFVYDGQKLTNLEMETAAIYGLSALLGHDAISMNAIVANRADGTFREDPYQAVDSLIQYTLEKLVKLYNH